MEVVAGPGGRGGCVLTKTGLFPERDVNRHRVARGGESRLGRVIASVELRGKINGDYTGLLG